MAMSTRKRRNLIRSRWIRAALAVAFGSFGVGFIFLLAQTFRPNLVSYGLAFLAMAVVPLGILAVLNRLQAKEMPNPDPDTLINVAGLLVTSAGFNLIPIWKWLNEALKTSDGWLMNPLPEPDFSLPNLVFTFLALGLSVVALFRGFKNPHHKMEEMRAANNNLQQAKRDLLKVVRHTPDLPKLKQLQADLKNQRFSMNPEEAHEELHRILRQYLHGLRRRRRGFRQPGTRRLTGIGAPR